MLDAICGIRDTSCWICSIALTNLSIFSCFVISESKSKAGILTELLPLVFLSQGDTFSPLLDRGFFIDHDPLLIGILADMLGNISQTISDQQCLHSDQCSIAKVYQSC